MVHSSLLFSIAVLLVSCSEETDKKKSGLTLTPSTSVPSAPTLLSPSSNPYKSAESSITVSGTCQTGAVVTMSGQSNGVATCTDSQFSFTLAESSDGDYNYSFTQMVGTSPASQALTFSWSRNSSIPQAPIITSPTSPFNTNQSQIAIEGTCNTGNLVVISGAEDQSTTCVGGLFSFTLSKSVDGTYNYNLVQKDVGSGLNSPMTDFILVMDLQAPANVTFTSPSTYLSYSRTGSLAIAGGCETGAVVSIIGEGSSANCVGGVYSIEISKPDNGDYLFSLIQTDAAGNSSSSSSIDWIFDSMAPSPISITSPSNNPFVSGDSVINVVGNCESSGATVNLSGDAAASVVCTTSGTFSIPLSVSADGTYNYSLVQIDGAGNTSAAVSFQWVRNASIPATPTLVAPNSNPYYSSSDNLVLTVSCSSVGGYIVDISGDVTGSASCNSGVATFNLAETVDGSYNFFVVQNNTITGESSASLHFQWIRDTVAPADPVISSPSFSPYVAPGNIILSGNCEKGAKVYMNGSSSISTLCDSSEHYTFSVSKTVDATYDFSLHQEDEALNKSGTVTFQWVRDSSAIAPPQLTSPKSNPYFSNFDTITLVGNCTMGATVQMSGDVLDSEVVSPVGQLKQDCLSNGVFSYTIKKATEGSFSINLLQTVNGVDSSTTLFSWIYDNTAPLVSINSSPPSFNLLSTASFGFTSNESNVTYQCKLDSGTYSTCVSPYSLNSVSNGVHTFYVQAVDLSKNLSSETSSSFTQAAYNSMALFHFTSGANFLMDSGGFTSSLAFNNNLTATGTISPLSTGVILSGSTTSSVSFSAGSQVSVNSNESLQLGARTMTIEGFFKVSKLPNSGSYYTLVSKTGTVAPDFGWEVRLAKGSTSSSATLGFVGALDNNVAGALVSSSRFNVGTSGWYYFAVTWNLGTVSFYVAPVGGTLSIKGTGTIGKAGSALLATSSAPLRIGPGVTTVSNGAVVSMDEVRISQVLRSIKLPTTQFGVD